MTQIFASVCLEFCVLFFKLGLIRVKIAPSISQKRCEDIPYQTRLTFFSTSCNDLQRYKQYLKIFYDHAVIVAKLKKKKYLIKHH